MKTLKWASIIMATLLAFVLIFYAEEDWRGWHAWQKCKHEFAAKGFVMDWDKLIPPPVPDDQNFFKAPNMTARFVKLPAMPNQWLSTNDFKESEEFSKRLQASTKTTAAITNESAARDYLTWSDQFQPDFDLMREALKRPYARIDGDYSKPYEQPFPNFTTVRNVAQVLAQRAKCYLLLGQPDKAMQELTLLHDMCRVLEAAPTGKPMTLVTAMINVAVTGLYVDTVAEGVRQHLWQEPQLAALQMQLVEINLTPFVFDALQEEPARLCRIAEIVWIQNMTGNMKWSDKIRWRFWPRGWTYQNMVNIAVFGQKPLNGFDLVHDTVEPRKFEEAFHEADKYFWHSRSPYKLLAAIAASNFTKAEQTTAHNQTMVNEAQVACALERYRLATGVHPGSLDALVPHFIETLPHDLIGGQPLIYRPTADGKFLLYSVGWNEKDDGGQDSPKAKNGGADYTIGDWVWKH